MVLSAIFGGFNFAPNTVSADTVVYKTGANSVSDSYKSGRYYNNLMQVNLTGDGVTDVLAVALSQLGYQEGSSAGAYSGMVGGSSNYTEYYYNFGMATNTWSMEWCAAFCSWALLQSGVSPHSQLSDWCRNHMGDGNYIWREISCPYWSNQLKNLGRYGYPGAYIPKSGDLIFFNRSNTVGHIGLVVWCDGSTVYTIEGNTSSGSGVDGNGGGVYYKSYALSNTGINGYGILPYPVNASAPKVDYSGANKTAGLYIAKSNFRISSPVDAGHPYYEEVYTVPQYEVFKVKNFVKGVDNVDYAVIQHGTGTYYGKLNSNVMQITAEGHVHEFGFTYDATHHMDRCECGERKNVVEHDFQPAYDDNEHFLKCSCGYKKPKSYGTHEYNSYTITENTHIVACSCGRPDSTATEQAHEFNIEVEDGVFACVCGAELRDGSTHVHSYHFTYTHETHMDRCDECGSEINYTDHDFQPAYDDKEHFLQCWCGYKKPKSYGVHDIKYIIGETTHKLGCECGYVVPGSEESHNHSFTYDATNHMDRCECGDAFNFRPHEFRPSFDEEEHFLKCSCGYEKPKSWGKHEYNSLTPYEDGHIKACSCGAVEPNATKATHSFTITVSDGVLACSCGVHQQNGSVHNHNYHFTYTNDTHMDRCDECGSQINYTDHDYKTVYTDSEHYMLCWCGYVKPRSSANHTLNYVCDETTHKYACACGYELEAEEHNVVNGICTICYFRLHDYNILRVNSEGHWYECECGDTTEFEEHFLLDGTCIVCDYHEHDFVYNCDSVKHWGYCDCGEDLDKEEHQFDNGECDVCGFVKEDDSTDNGEQNQPSTNPGNNDNQNGNNSNNADSGCGMEIGVKDGALSVVGLMAIAVVFYMLVRKTKKRSIR